MLWEKKDYEKWCHGWQFWISLKGWVSHSNKEGAISMDMFQYSFYECICELNFNEYRISV
jgi:hypothetical protein